MTFTLDPGSNASRPAALRVQRAPPGSDACLTTTSTQQHIGRVACAAGGSGTSTRPGLLRYCDGEPAGRTLQLMFDQQEGGAALAAGAVVRFCILTDLRQLHAAAAAPRPSAHSRHAAARAVQLEPLSKDELVRAVGGPVRWTDRGSTCSAAPSMGMRLRSGGSTHAPRTT